MLKKNFMKCESFFVIFVLILFLFCTVSLCSCETVCETHAFDEWQTIIPATCESAGKEKRICRECGESEERPVDAKGHIAGAWVVVKEAACATPGKKVQSCINCNTSMNEEQIPPLNHILGAWVKVEPTCTKEGSRTQSCEICQKALDIETYPALGHDKIEHAAQRATCTQKGWFEYKTCSRCNYNTFAEESALGHDEINHAAKSPTCTENGWDSYVTCSRKGCGYSTFTAKASLGHDEQPHVAKAATCTTNGWDAYVDCARCDYTTYREIPAHHDEIEYEAQAPTYDNVGWDAYVACSRCDYSTYVEIPALKNAYIVEFYDYDGWLLTTKIVKRGDPMPSAPFASSNGFYVNGIKVSSLPQTVDQNLRIDYAGDPLIQEVVVAKVEISFDHNYSLHLYLKGDPFAVAVGLVTDKGTEVRGKKQADGTCKVTISGITSKQLNDTMTFWLFQGFEGDYIMDNQHSFKLTPADFL